jgi:drug/metabolite transporter (DMT)-like permease
VRPRPLLALLILVWAVSWPVIKVGVGVVPPIWFACLRYAVATGVLVAIGVARDTLRFPSRADRRLVLVSGVLQMAAYAALTALALTKLPAGRASVLAFSTPLWVVPLAVWRRQERLSWRAAIGVVVGLVGIVVIALPSLAAGGASLAPAYAMLIAAAAAWAVSIVVVREHRFEASSEALAPWQTLVAGVILLLVAIATEGRPPNIGTRALLSLAYVGPIATAFAYWAIVDVGRRLPASTLSVALLATPSLGLLISALALAEPVNGSLIAGMVLVGAGIRLAGPVRRQRSPDQGA